MAVKVRLLRQVGNRCARLQETLAAIQLDQARERLEQRRLASAVAADQADPIAPADREAEIAEQRIGADPDGGGTQRE